MDREDERIDAALWGLLEGHEERRGNQTSARLLNNPDHLHLFTLWWSLRGGMAGESLYDLWRLSREPGSAALFEDILTLLGRMDGLRELKEWMEADW